MLGAAGHRIGAVERAGYRPPGDRVHEQLAIFHGHAEQVSDDHGHVWRGYLADQLDPAVGDGVADHLVAVDFDKLFARLKPRGDEQRVDEGAQLGVGLVIQVDHLVAAGELLAVRLDLAGDVRPVRHEGQRCRRALKADNRRKGIVIAEHRQALPRSR